MKLKFCLIVASCFCLLNFSAESVSGFQTQKVDAKNLRRLFVQAVGQDFEIVKDEMKKLEPALLTADIGSGFFNLSVLIPERDRANQVIGLVRPAILGFEGNESGCSFIGNPVWDAKASLYRMNSFCNDSLRSVALEIPASN